MRSFLIFVVFAGLGLLYLWQKQHETAPASATVAAAKAPVAVAQLTPAPRGVASEHNWMKRSLDRAKDVTEDARARTKRSQDP